MIIPMDTPDPDIPGLRVVDPILAAAIIHKHLLSETFHATGIHSSAHVGDGCRISEKVSIGPQVVIGDRVCIDDRVTIHAGTVISDDVTIGEDTLIYANVTIREQCKIGQRVTIHPGVVIGSDGFGFATDRSTGKHVKRPQVGIVKVGNDVEIGANTCIDRAAFGKTVIRDGVMIDNLVQVAHNETSGKTCAAGTLHLPLKGRQQVTKVK